MKTEKDDIADIDEIELDLLENEHYEVKIMQKVILKITYTTILFVGQGYEVK